MKIIQDLSEMILEEVHDAERYANAALQWKDSNKSLADAFFRLSNDEMSHMKLLHDEAVKLIEDYRKTNGEPPAPMLAVYDYLHKKQIAQAGIVRGLQAQYKGA